MLPSNLCGIGQCLRADLLSRKRAANLPPNKVRMLPEGLEVDLDILQQGRQGGPLMVVRDLSSRPAPAPCDPMGVGIVGRRGNDPQGVLPLLQPLAHQLRARGRMGAQVVDDHQRHAPAGARPGDSGPPLGAQDSRRATWGQAAVKPALTPSDEAEAIDLVVGARGLDQLLPATALPAPDPRKRGLKRQLDLILELEIGVWQEGPPCFHVWRYCLQEIGLDKGGNGWRGWRASPGHDHLHPEACPT
jgi:hypothetical protein